MRLPERVRLAPTTQRERERERGMTTYKCCGETFNGLDAAQDHEAWRHDGMPTSCRCVPYHLIGCPEYKSSWAERADRKAGK